jgi:uncharacterized protein
MRARATSPLLCALLLASAAEAYRPPLPQGWVTDTAGKLSPADRAFLNQRLQAFEKETGAQVFVFIPASLQGEPIEDVAYATFQTWKIGQKGQDNGVLLLWAPSERRVYIQTGKGVGGDLTDVQSFRIIQRMKPYLQADRAREALQVGTDAIMQAISGRAPPDALPRAPGPAPNEPEVAPVGPSDLAGLLCPLLILLFVIFVASRGRRRGRSLPFPIFWGGGGGWGGGSGGGGGGWGDGGGGGFSGGGGGETGGGGAGDSY